MSATAEERQAAATQCSPAPRSRHDWLVRACDLLFPPVCSFCRASTAPDPERSEQLCSTCVSRLTSDVARHCKRCARPQPAGVAVGDGCPHCQDKRFRFQRTHALGVYGGELREAVLQMKQASGETLTLAMGRLLAKQLRQFLESEPDRVVSVPTHWSRRLGRTVNCPELLLDSITSALRLRSSRGLLRCRRRTRKQGTLLPTERKENVRGAYAVSAGYAIKGQEILVLDDVMTTGATANEIARVLLAAGAARVSVGVVARGIGFDG